MRNEMASDATNMRLRQAQYERILSHENIPVHVLEKTNLSSQDKYSDARNKAQFGDAVNSDTGVTVTLNKEGYGKTIFSIKKMDAELQPAALAALANYKTLIADGVYVGSYPDYGESANIKQMHCFVAAFEYGGEQYRAMYTAKETRNSDGTYSTKLYLQRVEALKAQKNAVNTENLDGPSGPTRMHYISSTADTSIASPSDVVNDVQRVEALKAKNNAAEIEDRIAHNSSDTGINYINTSAANVANVEDLTISSNETERTKNYINDATNGSIASPSSAVNTIDAKTTEINFQPTKIML